MRSYVQRSGRITKAQQNALKSHWPHYGLDLQAGQNGLLQICRGQPLVLEIGFGNGESLLAQAKAEPDHLFIGVEVYSAGIGQLLHQLAADAVKNVRLYHADALDVLQHCIPDQSLDRLQLYFPDPWPKKKHHKRRLLQSEHLPLFVSKLKPSGLMALATDVASYAESITAAFAESDLNAIFEVCDQRPTFRPETKFERRGRSKQHRIFDFIVRQSGAGGAPEANSSAP